MYFVAYSCSPMETYYRNDVGPIHDYKEKKNVVLTTHFIYNNKHPEDKKIFMFFRSFFIHLACTRHYLDTKVTNTFKQMAAASLSLVEGKLCKQLERSVKCSEFLASTVWNRGVLRGGDASLMTEE